MLNTQAPEAPVTAPAGLLEVHSVFYTIQGEGPYAGLPAVFIRLAGCNLRCHKCDTDYTSTRHAMGPGKIVSHIEKNTLVNELAGHVAPLIVITGGEPFRQDFDSLVYELNSYGYDKIQVETNGTLPPRAHFPASLVDIVCSPKTPHVNEMLQPHVRHLKYVVENGLVDPADGLPVSVLGKVIRPARPWKGFAGTVWIQPEDSGYAEVNSANARTAVESAKKFGYRVSVQTHKILGVP